ncbi:SDR family oxidoreductase [Phytohabitans sp. ZYX-F-186]|uniref:SDR family oxidoreductase n=1 Tax=Phytohabitans maris TaxID=3071409 RepID=A0ABU0ZTT3_9ACTN|nr:SDR family NAD(P)-dependent oxidoreductase [Phytohabitans sp. ZYX-F-186]MDQ7910390.1 SDR family oxidoreductase [Phytohabitans sp. ZYX-F-186]
MAAARVPFDLVIAMTPCGGAETSPRLVAAARAGGGVGVLDLAGGGDRALSALTEAATGPIGVRVPAGCVAEPSDVERAAGGQIELVVLPVDSAWPVAGAAGRFRLLVEVTSHDEARAAAAAGAHGLIARGAESGGRVSELSAFVLAQRLLADETLGLPVWVAGGIGPRTAAACVVGGAAGVVLDSQLALMPESELPDEALAAIRRMDGSETVLIGEQRGLKVDGDLLPVGTDGWLASVFTRRWRDTRAAVRGIRAAILDALDGDAAGRTLAPDAPLAQALGIRIPVAQGPMTRVSDEAPFAAAVAADGALPFVALALADAEQSRRMLTEAAAALGEAPWGVGVLGFAPEELRAAQIEVIREVRPRCVIIAGGRPAQAKALEAEGIAAFLHVPSPVLLKQFLRAGARRFVFEGAECGGHVGPRTSFPLWEAQLAVLEEFLDEHPAEAGAVQVFFAGGIHDARSAAMVAALAAPLTRRGVRIGVLMGTAYLFTREAVDCGAVRPLFQRAALEATGTALLETAPGHATRCVHSPFVDDFHRLRTELEAAGVESRQMWEHLETLNVGRLRIASKGLRREGDRIVAVDEAVQHTEGLFMAGQVAVLRTERTTVADLHRGVTAAAADFHRARVAALRDELALDEPAGQPPSPLDIAIVGMSCVFPGSPDLAAFWRTILDGRDTITEVPADRWDVEHYYAPEVGPGQTGRISVSKWGGFIDPVPFDAIRYGIPPAALASIDPTQLLALELSHRALVDAGYPYDAPGADHSRTGVIFGAEAGSDMANAQTLRTMLPAYLGEVPAGLEEQLPRVTEDSFPGILANVIAGRVANRLDLGGPNFTVDAACASSLAALDAACKELATGGSDLMICGGADLHNGINDYLMFTSAHALSPTGRCRTFDSTGDGIALGEGVACLVLKRLADAERDGDRIYAVVKGVGASSDGRALGLTAPRPAGQRRALDRAYHHSGVSPRDVELVEAHGTGTVVGDRTELETLTTMFQEAGAEPGGCVLGSVKSQIGHTKCAAGLAGVIKTVLALHTGVKPPTSNLSRPNPAWDPERSPFVFHTAPRPWLTPHERRYAGVSAFGFGGTNYHVVLAAHPGAPQPRHARDEWPAELFCFRGADRDTAYRAVEKLVQLAEGRTRRLRDLAAALARESDPRGGPVQVAVVARDVDELLRLLRRALAGEHAPGDGLVQPPSPAGGKVAFLFPGQGSQRPGSLAELFVAFPDLRRYLHLGQWWAGTLFPPSAFDPEAARAQEDRVRDTRVAQPVLGIGGLAVDHLLRRLGVRPDMAGGHSYGELVALCVAGAYDPAALLALSRDRAASILAAAGDDPGTMAAVAAAPAQVHEVIATAGLTGDVVLANHNGPAQVVISGPTPAVRSATAALKAAGLSARAIPVACAFHSPVVAAGGERFAVALAGQPVAAPRIPVWANRTAAPYPAGADAVRAELAAQIGAPVRFVEQIEAMYASGARVFVEAGPGGVLTKLVRAVLGDRPHLAVACDGQAGEGLRAFLTAIAELACAGVPVRPGWLFHGRTPAESGSAEPADRPMWTVDGQLVRDSNGDSLRGGMAPPRRIKELSMNGSNGSTGRDSRDELLSDFLRTSREMIASQRDVLLAYLGGGGQLVWQPAPVPAPAAIPAAVATLEPEPEPAAPPVQAVTPAAAVEPAPATLDFQGSVLAVISERTGYPVDLIELDLDLEADLSVDSIKRAEVAGEVAARLGLSTEGDESELEDLVKARTVRAMVAWLIEKVAGAGAGAAGGTGVAALSAGPDATGPPSGSAGVPPKRLVTTLVPLGEPADQPAGPLAGATFAVAAEPEQVRAMADLLAAHGATVRAADPGDEAAVDGADGLLLLGEAAALPGSFPLVKRALAGGVRWLLAATGATGGDGLRGLFRTAAREYPQCTARLLVADGDPPGALVEELLSGGDAPVVLRADGGRYGYDLVPRALGALAAGGAGPAGDGVAEAQAIGLDRDSVLVMFGGARGITPWCARALAAASGCRLELVGRTPLPSGPQSPELAGVDGAELRAALARQGLRAPAEIERAARAVLAGREVEATLHELRELGAEARYHALDVRDEEAVRRLLKTLHAEHGRVDGLVYAAGVIEDKLIADKTPESFARVFGTKVEGARAVLGALDGLSPAPRFVVLFGSIAAAYGNRGQSDYAAANDALDMLGARWAADTGNRCLTVHWGPWAPGPGHGGMVTAELGKEYARRGIDLIDPEEGALCLLRELAWGDPTTTSVVYTASGW